MRASITAPLFALLSFVSLEDLTIPNDISEKPIVTIGYILHGFNFTTGDRPDFEFDDWQSEVLKKATVWLQSYYVNILLEGTTVTHATNKQSAEIEKWIKKNGLVYPPAILEYLKEDVKNNRTYTTDIVCLVTKVPLTLYEFGFGSYEPLCDDVVPVFLTYKKTWVDDVGDLLGQVILNSIKMNNYNEWYHMSTKDRNHYFKNCIAQRFLEDYF